MLVWHFADEGAILVHTKELEAVDTERVVSPPPTAEELTRRRDLITKILANAEKRVIAPRTSADLVHQVRDEQKRAHEDWFH